MFKFLPRSLLFSNVICYLIMLSSSPGNCLSLIVLFSFSSGGFVSYTATISEATYSEPWLDSINVVAVGSKNSSLLKKETDSE